MDETKGHVDTY